VRVLRARVLPGRSSAPGSAPMLQTVEGRIQAICGGGGILHLLEVDCDGSVLDAPAFARRFGTRIAPDPS